MLQVLFPCQPIYIVSIWRYPVTQRASPAPQIQPLRIPHRAAQSNGFAHLGVSACKYGRREPEAWLPTCGRQRLSTHLALTLACRAAFNCTKNSGGVGLVARAVSTLK